LSDEQIERLRRGVELNDGPTRPAKVTRLRDGTKHTHLEITIAEGRNRQVRRMLEAVDSKVSKLVRTAIGPIRIGDLPIGKWRRLSDEEVRQLGGAPRITPSSNTSVSRRKPRYSSPSSNSQCWWKS
jgi:23S rRNA pseudouridine2605 synthase